MIGLHGQGSVTVTHNYQQRWDSSTYTPRGGWNAKTTQLPNLKGKNIFQWQLMVPLGLEYVFNQGLSIRLEVDAGIMGNRFTSISFAARETHGAGLWLIYKPKGSR